MATQAYNLYRFGADARRNIGFHPMIKSLFHRLVLDPTYYLRQGFSRTNLCIPACIILAFHSRLGVSINRNLNIQRVEQELRALNFRSLLNPTTTGISLEQLSQLEELNSNPISPALIRLFPALAYYQGIAINQFRISRNDTEFRIFPVSLSKHSRALDRFQIDLLIDNSDIRPDHHRGLFDRSPIKHCLLITRLNNFVAKMIGRGTNQTRYQTVCRTCFRLFHGTDGIHGRLKHDVSCSHQTRGVLGRRKSRNVLIHRPYIYNTFTKRMQRNGLWFRKGSNFKLLRPLAIGFLDFESYHVPITRDTAHTNMFVRQPPSATAIQTPMSYSYCYAGLYPSIALPPDLNNVRTKFFDESTGTSLKDFYISLLLGIRKDLFLHSQFLQSVLARDRPPPATRHRSYAQRMYMLTVSHCQICGARFGSRRRAGTGSYIITRQFDHDHFLA